MKRLSFKDETYDRLSSEFGYVQDDLTKSKSKRDEEKANANDEATAGRMKKGTREDIFFEDLGFDHITLDEVQNSNHIVSKVKLQKGQASEYARFSLQPSALGIKTWLAAQYIQQAHNGRNVSLLSATPFTNHPLEYYSILSLVADRSLQKMGFRNVNEFFGQFMDASNEYEFKADGSYQRKTDIRGFKNYRQFRKLLDTYIDFREGDVLRPNRVSRTYEIPANQFTLDMDGKAQAIFKENEKEEGKGAKVLRAINELRKIALSPYASQFSAPPENYKDFVENSPKIKTLVELIRQNKKDRPDAGNLVYFDQVGIEFVPLVRQYLLKELGYAPEEVEIMTGATAITKRSDIQERYNKGKVKVLLASEVIKEGIELQHNSTDLYLLALPWNFTRLTQVIGRVWRQGNAWRNVRINNLFIQDSIDVFLSQKIENKQKRYEASTKSGEQEVDIGDISFDELKFDLIRDPQTRAKLELSAQKEKLSSQITQAQSELAFATRKFEKLVEFQKEITSAQEGIAEESRLRDEALKAGKEFDLFWLNRHTKKLATAKKEYAEEIGKLAEKGIDVEELQLRQEKGQKEIANLQAKQEALEKSFDVRVKEIAASLPAREQFSTAIVAGFVAERAEHNKTFFDKNDISKLAITAKTKIKEIKNAAGTKVVKAKKTTEVVKKVARSEKIEDIITDSSLTIEQRIDLALKEKQAGKDFKDVGERVAGSKKERAITKTIMESGDKAVMREFIKRVGADAINLMYDKSTILADAKKPDPTADKAAGVPSYIAYIKKDILDKIPRKFELDRKGRSHFRSWVVTIIDKDGSTDGITFQDRHSEYVQTVISEYPDILKEFVGKLADVKTFEELAQFWDWYEDTYMLALSKKVLTAPDGTEIFIEGVLFGTQVKGYKMETGGGWYSRNPRMAYDQYKEDTEKTSKKNSKENIEIWNNLLNRESWWTKIFKKGKAERAETELDHGNFAPLDHIDRSATPIVENKVVAETLMRDYGFKSVQLGNYMDDATAKEHIRHTIGAIEDMTTLLQVDFPAIANKTGLSIAFGARGGGRYNAHYEPTANIINLTKKRGDGSFGHEFMHFLDNKTGDNYGGSWSSKKERWYRREQGMGKARVALMGEITGHSGRKVKEFLPSDNPYISDSNPVVKWRKEGKTFEDAVEEAAKGIYELRGNTKTYTYSEGQLLQNVADIYRQPVKREMDFWNEETTYFKNSKAYGGKYWSKPEEMLARAFQAYLEDKMDDAGMKNNYLTRTTRSDDENTSLYKVYPQGDERKRINARFDAILAELGRTFPVNAQSPKEERFRVKQTESTLATTESTEFLRDFKERMKLDFDVRFVETILGTESINPFTRQKTKFEAWGVTIDNTIALTREMAVFTAEHEVVHLTIANLNKIPVFKRNGITKEKLISAWRDKNEGDFTDWQVEEKIAKNFEAYVNNKHAPSGIITKFFRLLKTMLQKFARAILQTNGDIITNYYDTLLEGREVDGEMVRLENQGIVESFIEDDVLTLGRGYSPRFKKKEGDKRLGELEASHNTLVDKQEKLEASINAWRANLEREMVRQYALAEVVAEGKDERVTGTFGAPGLIRFVTKTGKISERGLTEVENLGFANKEEAEKELRDYLKRKTELVESRKQLQTLRQQIRDARANKRTEARQLRDIGRKLKMRAAYLDRKGFFVDMGVKRGKRQQMRIIWKRGRIIRNAQDAFVIGDKTAKEIIGDLGMNRIHLMSNQEFEDFMLKFNEKAYERRATLDARIVAESIIQNNQYGKWENLLNTMGLPALSKMDEEQANRFVAALEKYQFGDVFLTTRQIETVNRTKWGDIKTEREMFANMQVVMGFGREEMANLTAPENKGKFTPWLKLSRVHPFFNWLVSRRMEAKIQEEREYHEIEEQVNSLTRAARASRRKQMGLGKRMLDILVPMDEIVFGYMEAKDKDAWRKKHDMSADEIALADYLHVNFHGVYDYIKANRGTRERQNYMTHIRRNFFETLRESNIKTAFAEILRGQREEEAVFKIIGDTGEVLAYDKFFGFSLPRSGALAPSKNIARASLAYFRAAARMRAMDAFVPEAMVALQAHKAVIGFTPKGLAKDPTLELFVKEFMNDAKGRKMEYLGVAQGSRTDIAARALITWVAIKYLGGNVATAIANFIGDFVVVFWELKLRETAQGIGRSFQLPTVHAVNKKFRFFTGRNPLVELFDPSYNMPTRFLKALMVLMSLANFQSQKFFLRAKMTEEEWNTKVLSDARLLDIAKSISRAKPNRFYVKSLYGNTTLGTANFQFGSWAVAVFNTLISDSQEVLKMLQTKKTWDALTSDEAAQVAKFVIMGGIATFLVSLMSGDDDDDDNYLIRRAKQELTTLYQAVQFATDPSSYFLAVNEIVLWVKLVGEVVKREKYKTDGVGYGMGDWKAGRTFKRLITPSAIKQLLPEQGRVRTPELRVREAIESGKFDANKIVDSIYGTQLKERDGDALIKYREEKIGDITALYNLRKNYTGEVASEIADILLYGNIGGGSATNDEKIKLLMEYEKEQGVGVYDEILTLYKDKSLCSGMFAAKRKKTGCLISEQFFADYKKERKK
ncbi:MAG: hypothetical protein AUJ71_01410 [Candidatus Omnitrophica bacterium CG1_02_49_16]|nr:MAG: hypothetical protein AUJ71_01410 [Candidatus Omnitrophica bacterium CG1_02_49_16]